MGCCHPGGCMDNGCFSHCSLLCLGWEFGASRDVCECIVPCFSYLKAPGTIRAEICCYSFTQVEAPNVPEDANVPLDIQCMSNLYVCSFAFGQYLPMPFQVPMAPVRGTTSTSAPPVQTVTKSLSPKDIPGVGKGVSSPMADAQKST